jgi:hypothetical protein
LRLRYDHSYGLYDYEEKLPDRFRADEKLNSAFKELVSITNTDPYEMQGPESLAEAGLLHKRRTDLSEPDSLSSSNSDEVFLEALEQLDLSSIKTATER